MLDPLIGVGAYTQFMCWTDSTWRNLCRSRSIPTARLSAWAHFEKPCEMRNGRHTENRREASIRSKPKRSRNG